MRDPKFLGFNVADGIAWGTVAVPLGCAAGASCAEVEKAAGRSAALIVVAIALLGWWIRKPRQRAALGVTASSRWPEVLSAERDGNSGISNTGNS